MENYHGDIYGQFHLALPIQKSYSVTENGETKMVIAGVASGVSVDQESDRMTDAAITAFQKAVEDGITDKDGTHSLIPLRTGHRKEWSDILGYVTKATVDDKNNLWIEAELDETSSVARDLFHKLRVGSRPGKPLKLGFSVGGFITKARSEFDSLSKKTVRVIEGVLLDEISVVGSPAFAPSFVDVLNKSTRWDDVPTYYQEDTSMTLSETVSQKLGEEAAALQKDTPHAVNPATARVADEAPKPQDNVNTDNATEVEAAAEVVDPVAEEQAAREAASEQARATAAAAHNDDAASQQNTQGAEANAHGANVNAQAHADHANADHSEGALKELQDQVRALQDSVAQLLAAQQNTQPAQVIEQPATQVSAQAGEPVQKAETEVVNSDVLTKSTQDYVAEAVTNALVAFKSEFLDPMIKDITAMQADVSAMAAQPMDKSLSVRPVNAPTMIEDFRKRLQSADGKKNPIRAAVDASLNGGAQE